MDYIYEVRRPNRSFFTGLFKVSLFFALGFGAGVIAPSEWKAKTDQKVSDLARSTSVKLEQLKNRICLIEGTNHCQKLLGALGKLRVPFARDGES